MRNIFVSCLSCCLSIWLADCTSANLLQFLAAVVFHSHEQQLLLRNECIQIFANSLPKNTHTHTQSDALNHNNGTFVAICPPVQLFDLISNGEHQPSWPNTGTHFDNCPIQEKFAT